MIRLISLALLFPATLLIAASANAAILTIEVYADVPDARALTFDGAGNLYTGRDAFFSGGTFVDAVKIHRIGDGGLPIQEYGNGPIADPDTVAFDTLGLVSGTPGSVLVGGAARITAIRPDQSLVTIFTTPGDVDGMVFNSTGRLFFWLFRRISG